MRRGYTSSRPATELRPPPKGPAPGQPPRQADPTLKGYLEEANDDDLEERYTRYLRRRHPIQAWKADRRRRRTRSQDTALQDPPPQQPPLRRSPPDAH